MKFNLQLYMIILFFCCNAYAADSDELTKKFGFLFLLIVGFFVFLGLFLIILSLLYSKLLKR